MSDMEWFCRHFSQPKQLIKLINFHRVFIKILAPTGTNKSNNAVAILLKIIIMYLLLYKHPRTYTDTRLMSKKFLMDKNKHTLIQFITNCSYIPIKNKHGITTYRCIYDTKIRSVSSSIPTLYVACTASFYFFLRSINVFEEK